MKLSAVSQWVNLALDTSRLKQADLARAMSKELGRDIDRSQVNKMVLGKRDLAADEMLAIEAITALPVPSPNVAARVPLVDWVSAGKLAAPNSQVPQADVRFLPFADLGAGDFIALKVAGDSMDRVSPDGSIIVVDRANKTLVGGKYYVFSVRGETTFKRWHADPPYLEPYSTSQHSPVFVKRQRDLAIVGRVCRTVLDL